MVGRYGASSLAARLLLKHFENFTIFSIAFSNTSISQGSGFFFNFNVFCQQKPVLVDSDGESSFEHLWRQTKSNRGCRRRSRSPGDCHVHASRPSAASPSDPRPTHWAPSQRLGDLGQEVSPRVCDVQELCPRRCQGMPANI